MDVKTFVVPLDGSEDAERALPVAAAFARRIGGSLSLLTAEFRGPLRMREYLAEVARRDFGCPVETHVAPESYAGRAIVDLINDGQSMLCMATHARGRFGWAAAGSVAEEVLQQSATPALLVGPHCRPDVFARPGRMLIASAGNPWPRASAVAVSDLAARLDLAPYAVVVAHPLDLEAAQNPRPLVDSMATQFRMEPAHVHVVHDDSVSGAITRVADALTASLVVLATHSRRGLSRFAHGSVTMEVVHRATCPVLALPISSKDGA